MDVIYIIVQYNTAYNCVKLLGYKIEKIALLRRIYLVGNKASNLFFSKFQRALTKKMLKFISNL